MKEKLNVIQMLHLGLCAGVIAAYVFLGDLSAITSFDISSVVASDIIYLLIPFLAYFVSNFLFKSQLKDIDKTLAVEENFARYQTASIIRWAVLEGSAFLILFIKKDFLIVGILIILYLVFLRPTLDKITSELT